MRRTHNIDASFGGYKKSGIGREGGFVVSNSQELIEKVGNTLSPSLVTSHHLNRLPALAVSILEMKEDEMKTIAQFLLRSFLIYF